MIETPSRSGAADPRITIVIPARNEARNLEIVLPSLPPVHQVILVDGNSVDDTIGTALRVMPSIEVVKQTRTGKGNALACGFAAATGDIIVMFDADGSADAAEIPAFVDALMAGADVAKGSRFRPGGGSDDITPLRRAGNYALCGITNVLLRTRYTDLCYGYNAFWRHIVPQLRLPAIDEPPRADGRMHWGDGFEIETLLNCRIAAAGMDVVETASIERSRIHGDSNLDALTDGLRVLKTIWTEFRAARRSLREPGVRDAIGPDIAASRPAHIDNRRSYASVVEGLAEEPS